MSVATEEALTIPTEQFRLSKHNGMLTISNPATGQHRTFRIRTQPADAKFCPGSRIISLLTGPDRSSDWKGFAFVRDDGGIAVWKSCQDKVYGTYANMIFDPAAFIAKGAEYMIEGTCRRCNRPLTHPESIATGLGPICGGRE